MGVTLLEHDWNAVPEEVVIRSLPFLCYERK
jgi:hypothetical protein